MADDNEAFIKNDPDLSRAMASLLEIHGNPDKAMKFLEKCKNDDLDAQRIKANCYKSLKRWEDAEKIYDQCLSCSSEKRQRAIILNNKAIIIMESKNVSRYREGIKFCRQAMSEGGDAFHYPREMLSYFVLALTPSEEREAVANRLKAKIGIGNKKLEKILIEVDRI